MLGSVGGRGSNPPVYPTAARPCFLPSWSQAPAADAVRLDRTYRLRGPADSCRRPGGIESATRPLDAFRARGSVATLMTSSQALHAVVIAGGSGTRFWPLSRRAHPKQLLNLSGSDTLLHATFKRVEALAAPAAWWMVVGESH